MTRSKSDMASEARHFLEENDIEVVRLELPDIDGLVRGKWISAKKLIPALSEGVGISNIILGYDINDIPYDPADPSIASDLLSTWDLGPYGDVYFFPDVTTLRELPWRSRSAGVICDLGWADGAEVPHAPRTALKRITDRMTALDLAPKCALEYEFLLFAENPRTLREKGFRNLTPAFEGVHSYSLVREHEVEPFVSDIIRALPMLGIELEAFHTEYAPGNFEITFKYADPLTAADTAARFKLAVKLASRRHNMIATFMARSMEGERASGMGGHLHLGLSDSAGQNVLWGGRENQLSERGLHFLGGILDTLCEFSAFYGPTVNSYRRTVPNSFAPTNVTWGYENRSAAIRVLAHSEPATRLEVRRPGADANPYLVIAGALTGGYHGLDRDVEPPEPLSGNAYMDARAPVCPTNLIEATDLLTNSEVATRYLGSEFVNHFAATRRWEWSQYSKSVLEQISSWELERYFEMI